MNNGVDNFISNNGSVRAFGNCITIANSGSVGQAFYHPYDFVASDHVTELKNENLSRHMYMFLLPIISRLSEKYNFNHEINDVRIRREKILLPATTEGEPDWAFMEKYIREREENLVEEYKQCILNRYVIRGGGGVFLLLISVVGGGGGVLLPLNQADWREFFIEDVATIESGRDIYEDERKEGNTPYVSSSSQNNGVCHFVSNNNETKEAGCISVNRNGSVGYAFYHPYPALYSNDCRKLRMKVPSKHAGIFIAAQITAQRGKYSYGYKMGTGRLKRQLILLPATADGEPDWAYMEQYIREQEDRLMQEYREYIDKYFHQRESWK